MKRIWILILLVLIGFIIVALPDSDKRLFSISKDHGPSMQDAIGLLLILFSYAWLVIEAWKRKSKLLKYKNSTGFIMCVFLIGLGFGLIVASVAGDHKYWWIYGIVLVASIQTIAFFITLK